MAHLSFFPPYSDLPFHSPNTNLQECSLKQRKMHRTTITSTIKLLLKNVLILTFEYVYRAVQSSQAQPLRKGGGISPFFYFPSTSFKLPLITMDNSVPGGMPIFSFFSFVPRSRDNWSTCWFSSLSCEGSDTHRTKVYC